MKKFAPYVLKLANLVEYSSDRRRAINQDPIASALDGEPSRMLRDLVDLETRRESGAFFSGSELGASLTKAWKQEISSRSVIFDPACGGGDLLLAAAKLLPIRNGLRETLKVWGANLSGVDLHQEFIMSTKYRLALQAISSGAMRERLSGESTLEYFPNIRRGDGLSAADELANATHVVTNPPFSPIQAPAECTWTSGLVNSAALFMESISMHSTSGTRIWAILPDVLRSGSRYNKWRQLVESQLRNIKVTLIGQFSRHADVDVFVLEGIVRARPSQKNGKRNAILIKPLRKNSRTVGNFFTVSVGSVVPHRHPDEGLQSPYLTPHNCPEWKNVTTIDECRGFSGTLFKPPLVVLRRTSRSDDPYRAIGTIVTAKKAVAIENHLLVLTPHSGTIVDCKRLLQVLKSKSTNNWLNQRICCRHLTVSAVKSIPWNLETK